MVQQGLIDYIDAQLKKGIERERVILTLLDKGWQEKDIHHAFTRVKLLHRLEGKKARKRFVITSGKVLFVGVLFFILACGMYLYFYYESRMQQSTEVSVPVQVK